MRVLHVVTLVDDEGSHGSAISVAVNQCIELRRRGHDARIAGGWGGAGPAPAHLEGVPVHLFRVRRLPPGPGHPRSAALLRWVAREGATFDVAHLHLTRHLLPLSVAAELRLLAVPYVVQTHDGLEAAPDWYGRRLDRRLTRATLLAARHVYAASPEERDAIVRVAGDGATISLLPGGVVLPDRVPVRDPGGPLDVLFLGRLHPDRRVLAFAAAADRLVADGVEATFAIVGPDGGDLPALRRFLDARPHLAGRVRYEGALPHGRALDRLRRADVYVLPAVDGRAYPMSLLEAMAAGVPSICTTACGLAGTLAREQAAVVANPTDDALYGAMRRLLTHRDARARLSARAAHTAASVFSMAPVAEVLEEEYATPRRPTGARGRHRLMWVVADPGPDHVPVWDAVHAGAGLVVVVLGGGPRPDLAGHGYPVLRVPGRAGRPPAAVRALLRDAPDAVALDGLPERTRVAVARWARQAGARVVVADGAGPGATARAALGPGGVDLDLRTPEPAPPRPAVVDLNRRPRAQGRHRT